MRRMLYFLLVLCFAAGTVAVSASAETADDREIIIDYSGYTGGVPEDGIKLQADNTVHNFSAAYGVYGKAETDAAFLAQTSSVKTAGNNRYEQYRQNLSYQIQGERYIRLSAEMAFYGNMMDRWIKLMFANGAETKEQLITVGPASDGSSDIVVKLAGQEKAVDIPFGSWNLFEFILDTQMNQYDAYVSGGMVGRAIPFTLTKAGDITGVSQIQFGLNHRWSKVTNMFDETRTYIDSLRVGGGNTPSRYTPPHVVTFSDYTEGMPKDFITTVSSENHTFSPYTRGEGDTALLAATAAIKNDKGDHEWLQGRQNIAAELGENAYFAFSTEFCFSGIQMQRWVGLVFNGGAAEISGSNRMIDIYRIDSNTVTVKSNGVEKEVNIPFDQWFKLDFVLNTALKTYSAYLNGEPFATNEPLTLNKELEKITGVSQIQYGLNQQWDSAAKKFGVTKTYLDNIQYYVYNKPPAVLKYDPGADNSPVVEPLFDLDFCGLERNTNYKNTTFGNLKIADENPEYLDYITYDTASDSFGRSGGDTSLYMHNRSAENQELGWFDQYLELPVENGGLQAGDSAALSFYLAFNDGKFERVVNQYCIADGVREMAQPLFRLGTDGTISVWGQEVVRDAVFTTQKWYKIDLISTAGDSLGNIQNLFELYVDNKLIARRSFVPALKSGNKVKFDGFGLLRLGQYTGNAVTNTAEQSGMYLDDVKVQYYRNGAEPRRPEQLSLNGRSADKLIYQKVGLETYTDQVDQLSGTNLAQAELVGGRYPVLTGQNGDRIFARVITEHIPVLDTGFDGCAEPNTLPRPPEIVTDIKTQIKGYEWTYSQVSDAHRLGYLTGLGGRDGGDTSVVLDTAGLGDTKYDPFINISMADIGRGNKIASYAYQPLTIEASVLIRELGDIDNANMQVMFGGSLHAVWRFDSDHNITLPNKAKAAQWQENRWHRMSVSIYPQKHTVDIYLNGEPIAKDYILDAGKAHTQLDRFKVEVYYPKAGENKKGSVAFDDICVYTGGYRGGVVSDIQLCSSAYEIDAARSEIFLPREEDMTSVLASLEAENPGLGIRMADGCLAVQADKMLKYYQILPKENAVSYTYMTDGVKGHGRFGTGTLEVTAEMTYADRPAQVIIAQYKDDILVQTAASPLSYDRVVKCSIKVDETAGTRIQILAITENMIPLGRAMELFPYSEEKISVDTSFYPGFVRKAVTFSFDDGPPEDETLVPLMRQYGLGGTFNLNSNKHTDPAEIERIRRLYQGFEIANHVKNHPNLETTAVEESISLIEAGRSELEAVFGPGSIRGFVYPGNDPKRQELTDYLRSPEARVSYARPSSVNNSFEVPEDFMDWKATCHFSALPSLMERYLNLPEDGELKLLYVWGHAYEFAPPGQDPQWNIIEEFGKRAGGLWRPSNIEYVDYIDALRSLEITDTYVHNPSGTDLSLAVNGARIVLKAGETYGG